MNGRNFANLMTLATGATSDGNGGWASVRFNGKSNQQNYLNYDGVDGTYVWDASPGYLNATGSQFRLQTSMESVAEFRVNSGLAPAESGLGAGGNITVVSKSGSNAYPRLAVRLHPQRRAGLGDEVRRRRRQPRSQAAARAEPVRRLGRRSAQDQQVVLLLQLRRPAPDHRPELHRSRAERRNHPPHPWPVNRSAAAPARAPSRTQAVAPLLAGFPRATQATANPLVGLASLASEAEQDENTLSFRVDHRFSDRQSFYVRYLFSDGEVDTPDRTVTRAPRPRQAAARRTWCSTTSRWSARNFVNEFKVGYNGPQTSASAFSNQANYDPVGVSLSGTFTSSSIDARGNTGIARSGLLIRATSASTTTGSVFDPRSLSINNATTWTRGRTR